MIRHRLFLSIALGAALSCAASFSLAEKMDVETHTLVIQKLEAVLSNLNADGVDRNPMLLRLGDLYSERARLAAMIESEQKSCKGDNCPNSRRDRLRALDYYNQALPRIAKGERDSVLLQVAHLYEMTQQQDKAKQVYNKAIDEGAKKHSSAFIAQSYAGLGEMAYKKGQFAEAMKQYRKALTINDCPQRGLIEYRIAWCDLNLGNHGKAIDELVHILKTPTLLTRETSDGPQVDKAFAEDVSRDLATFLARGHVTQREATLLRDLSPKELALDNMIYLGSEADRLGNKKAATYIFTLIMGMDLSPMQRLDAVVRLAQSQLDQGNKEQAVVSLDRAAQLWRKTGCDMSTDECKELQGRMRKMITDWDTRSRKHYQSELLQSYAIYNQLFTDDVEMLYWAGVVGRNLKQIKATIDFFHRASLAAADGVRKGSKIKNLKGIFQSSLLGEIEMAEIAKDPGLREAAYVHYLQMNPAGEKVVEVRYQKAAVAREKKQFKEAAEQFHDVALIKDAKSTSLRSQAAHIAIDILVESNNDVLIEAWGREFAKEFPKEREAFSRVARTASLKLVASAVTGPQADRSDIKDALMRLQNVSLAGASPEDKVTFYKAKILLAERDHNLPEIARNAELVLQIKGLSDADRDYALGRQVWVAEAQLDFASALRITKKMKLAQLSAGDRLLRMAMFAELAGQNPKSYYEQYVHTAHGEKSALVLAKIIRASKAPWADLHRYLNELKRYPEVLASVTLDIYARTKDNRKASEIAQIRSVGKTPSGQTLSRFLFLSEYQQLSRSLTAHRLPLNNERAMQAALAKRLDMIHQSEGLAQYAVNTQDWSLQVLALSLLGREERRLYSDLLAIPAPRRLKAKEKAQYMQAVQSQARPYLAKATDIDGKLREFWGNSRGFDEAMDNFSKARAETRSFAVTEMRLLSDVSGSSEKTKLGRTIAELDHKPSQSDLLDARKALRADPYSLSAVQKLKSLEEQLGHSDTMVVYLESRLNDLQSGGRK